MANALPIKKSNRKSMGMLHTKEEVEQWNMGNVCEWMYKVRSKGGIPMFKTKFAGVPFRKGNGEYCVQGVGWGAKGTSVWFCGVPEDVVKGLSENPSDFLRLYNSCPANYKKKIQETIPPMV